MLQAKRIYYVDLLVKIDIAVLSFDSNEINSLCTHKPDLCPGVTVFQSTAFHLKFMYHFSDVVINPIKAHHIYFPVHSWVEMMLKYFKLLFIILRLCTPT